MGVFAKELKERIGFTTVAILQQIDALGWSWSLRDDYHTFVAINRDTDEEIERRGDDPHHLACGLATGGLRGLLPLDVPEKLPKNDPY